MKKISCVPDSALF